MAFSLKWLLAGSAYAALAAAALSTGLWAYVDVLWAVTFFAVAYSIIAALFARGQRQVAAGGFAVASVLLLVCLQLSPDSVPTARLVVIAAKDDPSPAPRQVGALYSTDLSPQLGDAPEILDNNFTRGSVTSGTIYAGSFRRDPALWVATYRAANALATMLAGVIGALLGASAYRRQGRSNQLYVPSG